VSHAGTALLGQVADKVGLTSALSLRLAALKQRRRGHYPGVVIRDLAVMLADGGECVSDLGATREQEVLFGSVASDSTAFRMVAKIASTPGILDAVRDAHARALTRRCPTAVCPTSSRVRRPPRSRVHRWVGLPDNWRGTRTSTLPAGSGSPRARLTMR
jgi:Transposase DDE domain group 1